MTYTICYSKDLASMQEIELNKNGNKYYIAFFDANKRCTIRNFDNKKDAEEKFLLITQYFLDSWGDYEYRKQRLLEN